MKLYRQSDRNINHKTINKNPSFTFRQLINKQDSHLIKVNCNKEVSLVLQKMLPLNNQQKARKDRKFTIIVGKNENTLRGIFDSYQTCDENQEYVLVHKRELSKNKYQSRGKSLSNKSQTSIKNHSSNKLITDKYTKDVFADKQKVSPRKRLHSFFSQKIINNEQNVLKNYLYEKTSEKQIKIQQSSKETNNNDHRDIELQRTKKQLACQNLHLNLMNDTFEMKPILTQQMIQKNQQKQNPQKLNPKFSFGQIMKMGLIQQSDYTNKQSFQIAGDDSIERLKLPKNTTPNGLRSFQELSSIISNVKDETKKDIDVDSIKNQIQKINNCCIPKDKQFYNRLTNRDPTKQNIMNNNKEQKQLAPLKFRKKEEVVKHLVKAKIIFKQSNSINIS